MRSFPLRAYEIHSPRMWQQSQIDMAFDFILKHDMNALVLHENALVDEIIFPDRYFSNEILWKNWPVRRQGLLYRRDYMQKVAREAKRRNIQLFFETKEIYFDMTLLELQPQVRNADGSICPSHPFWKEFLRTKMEELVERIPELSGLIVSLGTQESLVSFAANRCHCERCQTSNELDFYISMLEAIYEPLKKHGKILMARDFSSNAARQDMLIKACEHVSEDIVVSLKIQPHDYWPTFPTNPRIGQTGKLRNYIEFDVWGQFFGSGAFPTGQVEDIKARLETCYEKGVWGVAFRTDWELMTEAHTHNCLSMVNLLAGSMLSLNLDTPLDDIYKTWVNESLYNPLISGSYIQRPVHPQNPDAWKSLKAFMQLSWKVFEKSYYIKKHIFLEHDQAPYTLEMLFRDIDKRFLDDWEPHASERVRAAKENLPSIFAEKDEALALAAQLKKTLDIPSLGLDEKTAADYNVMLDAMVYYVQMCVLVAKSGYTARIALETNDAQMLALTESLLVELDDWCKRVDAFLAGKEYPYYFFGRLPSQRVRLYTAHLRARLR